MLDYQTPAVQAPASTSSGIASAKLTTTMSRKRTRSRSEDNLFGAGHNHKIQSVIPPTFYEPAVFSSDPIARQRLAECDYTIRITKEMAATGTAPRLVRMYADGAFDLFHQGHARVLMQAKQAFPNVYLIVGVCSDAMLHRQKGKTVLTEEERYGALTHCRYVDEVLRDAPWELTEDFLTEHKIDFVAHDDEPYPSGDVEDIYAPLKARGMFVATQRTEGVSTSDLVARIVRDYDVYARRNLARGYSAKELNISFLKEKKLRFKNRMEQLSRNIGERKDEVFNKWEEKSHEYIDKFLMLFGRNRNRLSRYIEASKQRVLKAITPPGTPACTSSEDSSSDDEPLRKHRRLTD
ncbi:choline-phosphate cytidylyltransferase B-like isoform X2 [Atheta coriaria]|uniref:choline-phosphate cytidylyltransferase B-like isoform X2 n=1 Tax=Dalotia coriaria TaxID=877792 RepID=UPI0031F3940B